MLGLFCSVAVKVLSSLLMLVPLCAAAKYRRTARRDLIASDSAELTELSLQQKANKKI